MMMTNIEQLREHNQANQALFLKSHGIRKGVHLGPTLVDEPQPDHVGLTYASTTRPAVAIFSRSFANEGVIELRSLRFAPSRNLGIIIYSIKIDRKQSALDAEECERQSRLLTKSIDEFYASQGWQFCDACGSHGCKPNCAEFSSDKRPPMAPGVYEAWEKRHNALFKSFPNRLQQELLLTPFTKETAEAVMQREFPNGHRELRGRVEIGDSLVISVANYSNEPRECSMWLNYEIVAPVQQSK